MPQRHLKLFSISIFALRFLLPAWIGAAILFVITSVAEQTSRFIDTFTRDQLATIRFPLYYKFGTVIYAVSVVSCIVAWKTSGAACHKRAVMVLVLMAVSTVIFALDYFVVYSPFPARSSCVMPSPCCVFELLIQVRIQKTATSPRRSHVEGAPNRNRCSVKSRADR